MTLTEAQIKHMVDRFLQWRLPENFSPDAGISFKKTFNENSQFGPMEHKPIGTNLFDAQQATAMVRNMVEGMTPDWREQPWMGKAPRNGRWDTHEQAMDIILSAASIVALSYEEVALIYARARGFIVDDAPDMGAPLAATQPEG